MTLEEISLAEIAPHLAEAGIGIEKDLPRSRVEQLLVGEEAHHV
jgi:hypothetical protein